MPTTTIRFFNTGHLPPDLRHVAGPVQNLALWIEENLPDGPEKSAGMRKLLEAKDCFVRAALDLRTGHPMEGAL